MDTGFIKTNSVKYYGGWGDNVPSASQLALQSHAAAMDEIRKLLKKKSLKTREQFLAKLKKTYSTVAQTLLEEGQLEAVTRDGYLRKWHHDLGMP